MQETRALLPRIQMLRGVAALMVAISHLEAALIHLGMPDPLPDLSLGTMGVDLFFVVSGFIMVYSTGPERGTAAARRFLLRRGIRIVPIYWIVTTVAFAGMLYDFRGGTIPTFQRWHVLASYLFVPFREIEDQGGVYPIVPAGWTLEYEAMFYVAFAAALLAAPRFRPALLCGGMVAAVLAGLALPLPLPLSYWADPIVLEFVYGMAIAWALRRGFALGATAATGLAAAALACLAIEQVLGIETDGARALWWGLPAAALVAVAALAPRSRSGRLGRALEALGDVSYSLYLVHPFVFETMLALARGSLAAQRLHFRLLLPVMVAAAVLAAFALYRFVERPLTRALQRRIGDRGSAVPARLPPSTPAADPCGRARAATLAAEARKGEARASAPMPYPLPRIRPHAGTDP